jgi:predicted ArsR family transcriptional regulator
MSMLRRQLLDSGRSRIVTLLRGAGGSTADDIASKLGLTRSALRAQLTGMERDGLVRRAGQRPGTTRPSHVFEVTPEVERLLSSACIPLMTSLVDTFADALSTDQVETILRQAGKRLADELSRGKKVRRQSWVPRADGERGHERTTRRSGSCRGKRAGYIIRGSGCPFAALTGKHEGVCMAMESLVSEVLRVPVRECCDRSERPKCCFQIEGHAEKHRATATHMARGAGIMSRTLATTFCLTEESRYRC